MSLLLRINTISTDDHLSWCQPKPQNKIFFKTKKQIKNKQTKQQ